MSSNVPAGSPGSIVVCFRLQASYLKALGSFFPKRIQVYLPRLFCELKQVGAEVAPKVPPDAASMKAPKSR